MDVDSLPGKHVLIGITRLDHTGALIEQSQLHGDIDRIDTERSIIVIKLRPSGNEYQLPLDVRALAAATPGEYRLRSTGEVVVNPDILATWTIYSPDPAKNSSDVVS